MIALDCPVFEEMKLKSHAIQLQRSYNCTSISFQIITHNESVVQSLCIAPEVR